MCLQSASPPLVAANFGIGAVYALGLDRQGVNVVGAVPAGFPAPRIPSINTRELWPIVFSACVIVLVSSRLRGNDENEQRLCQSISGTSY